MNPVKFKQIAEASNLSEHIDVLKKEFRRHEAMLQNLVEETESVEKRKNDLTREVKDLEQKKKKIDTSIKTEYGILDKHKWEVFADAEKLDEDREEFEAYKKAELEKLKEAGNKVSLLSKEAEDWEKAIENLKKDYDRSEKSLHRLIDSITDEIESLRNELDALYEDREDALKTLSEAQNELRSVEKSKDEAYVELDKIRAAQANSWKNIEEREKEVARRERDLGIIKKRVLREYKRLHPNREVKL